MRLTALIKYPLSLFILLLIGYSQLFAPLYRGTFPFSPTIEVLESPGNKSLDVKNNDVQTFFMAEEEEGGDDRISHLVHSFVVAFTLLPEHLFPIIKSHRSPEESVSKFSLLVSPYLLFRSFRV